MNVYFRRRLSEAGRIVSVALPALTCALGVVLGGGSTASASDVSCYRYSAGMVFAPHAQLFSAAGLLATNLTYSTAVEPESEQQLFCYTLASGEESPVLRVQPGDKLKLTLINNLPANDTTLMTMQPPICGSTVMTATSTNVHFHGTKTKPICGQDDAVHTLINAGTNFTYDVTFPFSHPPGLYAYHPHVHGLTEAAILGGASGAIVVEGIQKFSTCSGWTA